jgi:3-deoxy-D-manno-octulosonate 8-phosphate phosphatase (KDO 8-P phosphatase)
MNILEQFKSVRLIAMDVDGVLTDGSLLLLPNLETAKSMNVKDGYAMQLAVKKGYHIVVISGAVDLGAVKYRLKELGIKEFHDAVKNKAALLSEKMTKFNVNPKEVLFIGDDIPDLEAMKICGMACCPADAAPEIKAISTYISDKEGGKGCVRDILEKILKANHHWDLDTHTASK